MSDEEKPHRDYPMLITTNLLERAIGEVRRRTKITPRFLDEKSCLKLVFSTLIRVSQRWRWIRVTSFGLSQIDKLRRELRLLPPLKEEKSFRTRQRVRKVA